MATSDYSAFFILIKRIFPCICTVNYHSWFSRDRPDTGNGEGVFHFICHIFFIFSDFAIDICRKCWYN